MFFLGSLFGLLVVVCSFGDFCFLCMCVFFFGFFVVGFFCVCVLCLRPFWVFLGRCAFFFCRLLFWVLFGRCDLFLGFFWRLLVGVCYFDFGLLWVMLGRRVPLFLVCFCVTCGRYVFFSHLCLVVYSR